MKTSERISTIIFWVFGLLMAVWVEYYAVVYLLKGFNLKLALAATFGLVCMGFGVRQLWKLLRTSPRDGG